MHICTQEKKKKTRSIEKKLENEIPNSVFNKRRDIVIKNTEDSYTSWKEYIDAERKLIKDLSLNQTNFYSVSIFRHLAIYVDPSIA